MMVIIPEIALCFVNKSASTPGLNNPFKYLALICVLITHLIIQNAAFYEFYKLHCTLHAG